MPATEAAPVPMERSAIDLAELQAHLEHRGHRLDEAALRHLGRALAHALAEAHAAVDDEGNPAPAIHGRLGPDVVRIDAEGDVTIVAGGRDAVAPELLQGGRLTPRADVYALGTMLGPMLGGSPDQELRAALAAAAEPRLALRRITCVELEAWLARGADLDAGRRALGEAARACLRTGQRAPEPPSSSRPLSAPARVGVALITAATVFAAGVAVVERWLR